jgi:hypothetical protein
MSSADAGGRGDQAERRRPAMARGPQRRRARPGDRAGARLRVLRHAERPLPVGGNFSLILQQVAVVGVIAIGQTLVILTGGIDLSCGMLMALGGIVMTRFATTLGMPPVLAILCGIARDRAVRARQRPAGDAHPAAVVHRHAGHDEHRVRGHAAVLRRADRHRPAAADDDARRHLLHRRHAVRVGHGR